jgi:hypothetical protein
MLDILEGDLTLLLTLKNGHRYQVAALKLIKAVSGQSMAQ